MPKRRWPAGLTTFHRGRKRCGRISSAPSADGAPITNAFTESINRLAKDKNRDGRGYSFEVMRARMLYTTKHKKKVPQIKESPFLGKATMTYSMGLPEPEKNYGVDLSTFWES